MFELNFPNAVSDLDDFYNRKDELLRAQNVFLSGARRPVVILGERRIGKSSLQNVVIKWLRGLSNPQYLPFSVMSGGIFSLEDLAKEALYRLCSALGKGLPDTGLTDASGRFHLETPGQFENAIARLLSPAENRIPVLCVDEFDNVLYACSDLERARILGLTQHLAERASLRLALLITMTRLPESLRQARSSLLVSKSETVVLHPFPFEAMAEMVKGLLSGWGLVRDSAMSYLFMQSGGHPYFAKLLLANLLQRRSEGHQRFPDDVRIGQETLSEAVRSATLDPRAEHALENIYRVQFDDYEKGVVLLLADRGEGGWIKTKELEARGTSWKTAARRLERRDYLKVKDGGYSFRIEFLGHWLRNWVEFEEELEQLQVVQRRAEQSLAVGQTSVSIPDQGVFVDDNSGRVYLDGKELDGISESMYRAFYILYNRCDQIISKDEFAAYVWDTDHYVGDDQRIYQLIRRTRKALGESARNPVYLETLPGRGFRLHSTPLRKGL